MIVGKTKRDSVSPLLINKVEVDFVVEWKYLGVSLVGGSTLSFSAKTEIRSFNRAFNSIFYASRRPNEQILVELLYTNCVPILSYACAVKEFNHNEMSLCNSAINNALRKIFTFSRMQSVRSLRQFFGKINLFTRSSPYHDPHLSLLPQTRQILLLVTCPIVFNISVVVC